MEKLGTRSLSNVIRIDDERFEGRRIWVLTIVDNFSRVSLGIWVGR
jgi:hypothetical protein